MILLNVKVCDYTRKLILAQIYGKKLQYKLKCCQIRYVSIIKVN